MWFHKHVLLRKKKNRIKYKWRLFHISFSIAKKWQERKPLGWFIISLCFCFKAQAFTVLLGTSHMTEILLRLLELGLVKRSGCRQTLAIWSPFPLSFILRYGVQVCHPLGYHLVHFLDLLAWMNHSQLSCNN